jgi:hypothetical protein
MTSPYVQFSEARAQFIAARAQYYLAMALEHPVLLGFLFGLGVADFYLLTSGQRKLGFRKFWRRNQWTS